MVGMDEVGRGALAGPVSVGAVAVDLSTGACPPGVADSKLLRPAAREALLPSLARWGLARAVGHASAAEIDEHGIVGALRLAGGRAMAALEIEVDVVLLDGSHDWLSAPRRPARPMTLLDLLDDDSAPHGPASAAETVPEVRTMVRADQRCSSVAAASILAKCERDALMVAHDAAFPAFGWAGTKGYGAPDHLAALAVHGPSVLHRVSWRLPGCEPGVAVGPAGSGGDARSAPPDGP